MWIIFQVQIRLEETPVDELASLDILSALAVKQLDKKVDDNKESFNGVKDDVKALNDDFKKKLSIEIEDFSIVDGSPYISYKTGTDTVTKKWVINDFCNG